MRGIFALGFLGCAAALLLLVCPLTPVLAADEATTRLEEVVVTARKREENLQTVPVSIAAFSAEDLRSQSVTRLSDLGQVTPNFLYGQQIQSGSSAGQIYIRGVGQHDTHSTFNPSVGLYVDGVYVARATANDLSTARVERLEVLYGPQGTLFGKNTNGGAINIVTRKPDPSSQDATGSVQLEGGNLRRFDGDANINLPLVRDTVALMLGAEGRSQAGFSSRLNGDAQANQHRRSADLQLLVRPVDGIEAVLRVDATKLNEYTSAFNLVEVRTASTIPILYAALTPYRYDNRWLTGDDLHYAGTGPNKNAGSVGGTSLTVEWKRGWGTLKSISAYRRVAIDSQFDPDGSPLAVLDIFNTIRQHQISQEVQAAGSAFKHLDWTLGVYYFHETVQDNQPANVALELLHGAANFDPRLHVVNQNYALYGQASYSFGNKLKLTAGARIGIDQVAVGRIQVNYPEPIVEQPFTKRSARWSSFLPRISLEYQWTPTVMTYLSAAEGTKTGGYNGRAGSIAEFNRFEPEKVWTYEFGIRSDLLNERLRFNATLFYSNYSDYQILLNRSVTDPATGNPVAFSFVGNMPKATITGAELAATLIPVNRLKLSAGLGITDGRYKTVLPGAPVTTESRFVDAPKFTLTTSAEYSIPVASMMMLHGRLDFIHKSTIEYDYGNSPLVAQKPYGLLNARLTLTMQNKPMSLFAWGSNLTDERYAVGGLDDGPGGSLGEVVKEMGAPREWGVGGEYRF